MKRMLCICSGGGHLGELIEITSAFPEYRKALITYEGKNNIVSSGFDRHYLLPHFLRHKLLLIILPLQVLRILFREKPSIILSTGAEIAIPFFLMAKLTGARLIYVESAAQVRNPSRTGRVLYHVADLFLVQWKSLLPSYGPKARYTGGLL